MKNPKYDGYQCRRALTFDKLFDEKTSGGTVKIVINKELSRELHKLI